jgi:hypothetical protein
MRQVNIQKSRRKSTLVTLLFSGNAGAAHAVAFSNQKIPLAIFPTTAFTHGMSS